MINNVLGVNSNISNHGWGNLDINAPNTQEIADLTHGIDINKGSNTFKKTKKKRVNDHTFLNDSFNNLDFANGIERQGNILNTEDLILKIVGDE